MIRHPRDLPAHYRELFEERAAIMEEGSKWPPERANQEAFRDILLVMKRDEEAEFRK